MTRAVNAKPWMVAVTVVATMVGLATRSRAQSNPQEVSSGAPTSSSGFEIGTTVEGLHAQDIIVHLVESDGSNVRTGYAATIVRRPVAQIIAAIHDVNHYRDFIPQFEQSQELAHSNNTQDFFVRISINHFAHLWARLRYHESNIESGGVLLAGRAVQGNVERMDVRWRATPIDSGAATVLEFWSLVLPTFPIPIPQAVLEGEQESAARRGVTAVKSRVEAEPVMAEVRSERATRTASTDSR